MTGKTTIEWATSVWNPTTGCTRVSAGCDNCYAFALHDKRYAINRKAALEYWERGGHRVTIGGVASEARAAAGAPLPWPIQYDLPFSHVQLLPDRLDDPLRHKRPETYFVDSMSDLFHPDIPDDYLDRIFLRMALNRRHTFLVLTKRPERMAAYTRRVMPSPDPDELTHISALLTSAERAAVGDWAHRTVMGMAEPPPNIWLGTSIEDQVTADERIPHLLDARAAVRFISAEPLLGPVNLLIGHARPIPPDIVNDAGIVWYMGARLDWVIVGGESGPRARPMEMAWMRSIVEQCLGTGVPVFVKQLGSFPVDVADNAWPYPITESHGRDMSEWPDDLRVRMVPS
jgi:Bacteriophage protein gp37